MASTKKITPDVGNAGDTGGTGGFSGENSGGSLKTSFVHLHLHSEYSLLDGGNKIDALLEHCAALGMDAVAVTDHGNLHGAAEFYTKAKKAGIKPILGIEAYVAPESRTHKKQTGLKDGGFHLVLLAENQAGWANLLKLSTDAFVNGFYYKPRMDKETLTEWSEGLIAINGHLGSSIAHYLTQFVQTNNADHYEHAKEEAIWHRECFGKNERWEPRFYLELQRADNEAQERINPLIIKLAKELDIPMVVDNDAHYLRAEDWDAHDSLTCISMNKNKDDPGRITYSRELWVKPPEAMVKLFAEEAPEAAVNTVRIAERCEVEIDFSTSHAPVVKIDCKFDALPDDAAGAEKTIASFDSEFPVGSTEWYKQFCGKFDLEPFDSTTDHESSDDLKQHCDGALRLLSEAGAIWRYGPEGITPAIRARLDRELSILAGKNISAYFLIVWDFVNWARQQGIPAMARGSGVGTMVGFVLGMSNACPEHYGLLFERFTDPDRSEYPDIDIDICQNGRGAVIDYVRKKYGHVAQIITFGRLKAKAAIKDISRVMGLTPGEGQRLANLVPAELNITLDEALAKEPDFKTECEANPVVKKIIETARALENHARHAGIHAAGVVIATQPLDTIVPLCKATGSEDIITQWDGPTCEKVGLLKMDFLGLRTLSTIETAIAMIRRTLPEEAIWAAVGKTPEEKSIHPLDMDRLTYVDSKVLELFRRADTAGVFQFESGGMRRLLTDMQPDRLEDLIAANALFRPGPMDLIPDYCARKNGKQPVPQVHEIVDRFTAETYGIMVYQEQVMQIVHHLGGIPLRSAYTLIKAISKKNSRIINANRTKFLEGAAEKGLPKHKAGELFDLILKFAGYGFNKSHSTAYAIVAYQTAYLKTYFPNQYMASVLSFESQAKKAEEWAVYLEECSRTAYPDHSPENPHVGVRVLPPDINQSESSFTVVFEEDEPRDSVHGVVRFGLSAVKGVGPAAIDKIMKERKEGGPFDSLFDFCERVPARVVNKAGIEAMIKGGAFDSVHRMEERAGMCAALEDALAAGQTAAEDRLSGQMNIFESFGGNEDSTAAAAAPVHRPLPSIPEWDRMTTLAGEKDMLGFHISGHPLDEHEDALREFASVDTQSFREKNQDAAVVVGGMFSRVRLTVVKQGRSAGQKMAMITIQDKNGTLDGVVFSDIFANHGHLLHMDAIVMLIGRVDLTRGEPQIVVDRVIPLEQAAQELATRVVLVFDEQKSAGSVQSQMEMAAGLLRQTGGVANGHQAELSIQVVKNRQRITLRSKRKMVAEPNLINRLREIVGPEGVHIAGGHIPTRNRTPQAYGGSRRPAMAGG